MSHQSKDICFNWNNVSVGDTFLGIVVGFNAVVRCELTKMGLPASLEFKVLEPAEYASQYPTTNGAFLIILEDSDCHGVIPFYSKSARTPQWLIMLWVKYKYKNPILLSYINYLDRERLFSKI